MNKSGHMADIHSSRLMSTTIIFLLAAPLVVILYCIFILNPANADNLLMYILQVGADLISIAVIMSLWLTILLDAVVTPHHRRTLSENRHIFLESHPSVDVFITTAGEPLEIVQETVRAAIAMDYPHKTYILDDGHSLEVEHFSKEVGTTYIARAYKYFAKSGNVNNGLTQSTADFFIIFDADQVPKKNFITRLLPYMADEKLAMVQSPQYFKNTHSFIANGTSQAQEIFYKHVCPAKNISNSAFCVGTNMIFRRSAITSIGGIAQVDHSEDIWTSFLLHEKGWETLFVNEVLAEGVAPTTINSFFRQQVRWSKGGLSMLFLHNPLLSKKLDLDQKLQYFTANFFYLVGFSILVYLLSPLMYLLFGVKALHTESGVVWLLHYLPYLGLYYSLTWLLVRKLHISTVSTALASFYPYILASLSILFGIKLTWEATTTGPNSNNATIKWIWPHLFIMFLTLFSFIVGWYNPLNFWTTLYNSAWAFLNLYLLFLFVTGNNRTVRRNL